MPNLSLFEALNAKMAYLNKRHQVLADNIANADTPGYKPKDLKPIDFGTLLNESAQTGSLSVTRTNPGHLTPGSEAGALKTTVQSTLFEVSPTGNAVSIEEQMVKSNQNSMEYSMMVNLYQKNMNLLRAALGR